MGNCLEMYTCAQASAQSQTFQLESPANLGISNSIGENPWRFYLKPGDIHFSEQKYVANVNRLSAARSLVPRLHFSSPPGKECSLKTAAFFFL